MFPISSPARRWARALEEKTKVLLKKQRKSRK